MHPILAQDLARARQVDTARHVAEVQLRSHAMLRRRARPPGPSRLRLATARVLTAAAQRIVPGGSLDDLGRA